jgi:CobQ-like glutamine amidotransferase family enzyme
MSARRIVIGHLFADLLNLYGDRGNIATLARRSEWRGIGIEVRRIGPDDAHLLDGVDLVFIGGGQDAQQVAVSTGLERIGPALVAALASGASLLAVCGGYQNLGHAYRSELVGDLRGPGLLDVTTDAPAGAPRNVGGIVIELDAASPIASLGRASAERAGLGGAERRLVGFENHSGRTFLGAGARPLGRVLVGHGNNDEDGAEGLIALPGEGGLAGARIGTYLHGPLLPRNPHLADYLIATALARGRSGDEPTPLAPLPDDAEWRAHAAFEARWEAEWADRGTTTVGRLRERIQGLVGF